MRDFSLRSVAILLSLLLVRVSSINPDRQSGRAEVEGNRSRHRRTIVGGAPAAIGAYPSFGVYGDFRKDRENLCGGVLIHPDVFITAAHCFYGRDQEILGQPIYLGANKLDRSDAKEVINVVALQRHPAFRPDFGPAHDLMLLKLETPSQAPIFRISSDLQRPADNERLVVLGFGGDDGRTAAFSSLMQVTLNAVNFETCNEVFGGGLGRNAQICAGGLNTDACGNDSGGPLLGLDGTLFGIVSFGVECGGPVPGVYARVNTAALFIQSFICGESSSPPPICFGPVPAPNPVVPLVPQPVPGSPFLRNPFPATNPVASPTIPVITWATSPSWISLTKPTAPTLPVLPVSPRPPPTPPSPVAAPTSAWRFILPQPTTPLVPVPSPTTSALSPIFTAAGNPSGSSPAIPIQWGNTAAKPTANFALPAGNPSVWTAASSPTWASSFARDSLAGEASGCSDRQWLLSFLLLLLPLGPLLWL